MYTSFLHSRFDLLACDYVRLDKRWNYLHITSTFYRLYYIEKGLGELYNNEMSTSLEPGFLYLIPSFTNCNYRCNDFLSQYYICFVEESIDGSSLFSGNRKLFKIKATDDDQTAIKKVLSLNPERRLSISNNPKVYEKNSILTGYAARNKTMPRHKYIETCGLLLQLISRFLAEPGFSISESAPISKTIEDALYYIQINLHSKISVTLLAKRANISADHFSRLFVSHTGELPITYIQIKKTERACLLLSTTNMPLYEIATETGFESLSYFTRIFKKITGQKPSAYRKNISGL